VWASMRTFQQAYGAEQGRTEDVFSALEDAELFASPLGECCSVHLALYAEPACDVVTETSPSCFHRSFQSSPASKLAKPAALFDPGMREFRNLRSLAIDLLRLFRLHLGFESNRCGRLLDASDGPPPVGSRVLRSALIAVDAGAASPFGDVEGTDGTTTIMRIGGYSACPRKGLSRNLIRTLRG
jgi:hypothetical protein